MDATRYSGIFWCRRYESNVDLRHLLTNAGIGSPLFRLYVDACMAVESRINQMSLSLPVAFVTFTHLEDGNFRAEAVCEGKRHVIVTQKCKICGEVTYDGHPHNGCIEVVVEEVMSL